MRKVKPFLFLSSLILGLLFVFSLFNHPAAREAAVLADDTPAMEGPASGIYGEVSTAVSPQSTWLIETVADLGQTSGMASIAVSSAGEVMIAYRSGPNGEELKLATRTGAGWVSEIVDVSSEFYSIKLAITANGVPRITYYDGFTGGLGLTLATQTPTGWQVEVIDSTARNSGDSVSLVLDNNGLARISYFRNSPFMDLRLATETPTGWQLETVTPSDGLHGSTIALGSDGFVRIAYDNWFTQDLRLATQTASGWLFETVASNNLWNPALALTSNDEARILYKEDSGGILKYARQTAGGWQIETVATNADFGNPRLRLDETDHAHMIYSSTTPEIIYEVETPIGWLLETVENGFSDTLSLALGANSGPYMAYQVGSFLKFAMIAGPPDFLSAVPAQVGSCIGSDAMFTVFVGSQLGYTQTVGLTAIGEPDPPGTAVFNPNHQPAPFVSDLTIGTNGAAGGNYAIDVVGIGLTSTHTTTVQLDLFAGPPGTPNLATPVDGTTGVAVYPIFEWTAVADAASYFLEIATDAAFNTIVYSAAIAAPITTHTTSTALNSDTLHYWRITGVNPCASGTPSIPFSFTTGSIYCSTPNMPINSGPHTDEMTITDNGILTDVNVYLDISHTWVGDLIVEIEYVDTGFSTIIIDQPGAPPGDGCSGDDIDAILDDEASDPVEDQCGFPPPAIGGSFIPNNPLSVFDGGDLSGTWRISITDAFPGADDGILNQWCIIPAMLPAATIVVAPASLSSSQQPDNQVTQTLTISNTGTANLDWTIEESSSQSLTGNGGENEQFGSCNAPSDLPWLTLLPDNGTTLPGQATAVDVVFDSTGYAPGIYTGTLCVNSNDTLNPQIAVPLTLTVLLLNQVPVAVADTYTTTQETALTVAAPGVLANDFDGDGDSLTAVLDTDVTHGTLSLNADGSFVYTPTVGFVGADSFTYYASDGTDDSNIVTVTITVIGYRIFLPFVIKG